jgi:Uma2 family endonuclease
LFVTPAPSPDHETIAMRLRRILEPYVETQTLGRVYTPRSVIRFDGSEAEPDLIVRHEPARGATWDDAPTPILVVEVLSPTTHRRDRGPKRGLYLDAGVEEYWIVDGDARTITCVRAGEADRVVADRMTWEPSAASSSLSFDLSEVF